MPTGSAPAHRLAARRRQAGMAPPVSIARCEAGPR